MRRYLFIFLLFVSASIAACASQSASNASSGGGGSSGAVVMNGCKVDPAPICDSARGQSVDMSNGMTADPRMVEQNSARTANIFIPIKRTDGQELFEVECGMNTLHQSVTWAQIKTGPPVTDDDVKFLRAQGLCSQS
jgi:hypothetical protein